MKRNVVRQTLHSVWETKVVHIVRKTKCKTQIALYITQVNIVMLAVHSNKPFAFHGKIGFGGKLT